MAQLPGTFNPDEHEDQADFDTLPAGEYPVQVIESQILPTKSGTGERLSLTLEIIDGEYERRRLWANLNIVNQSADAQRIGQAQLASLCKAAGIGPIDDTEHLHGVPVIARVAVKNDPTYGPKNEVKGFKPYQTAAPAPRPATRPAAQTARPAASGSRPWGQRANA